MTDFSSPATSLSSQAHCLDINSNTKSMDHRADSHRSIYQARRLSGYTITSMALVTLLCCLGCVRRSITITTEPTGALVFLNDQEVGQSTVTTDFLWYGDYDVVIRKEGYETLQTHTLVSAPWYQRIPLDFVSEVLWPGYLHDHHDRHFVLAPKKIITSDELIDQANEIRRRAIEGNN